MFTYREKNSAEEIQTTWEKVVQKIGIDIVQDISTELETSTLMVIPEPTHSQEILDRHMRKLQLHKTIHDRLREASNKFLELLAADAAINNLDAVLKT